MNDEHEFCPNCEANLTLQRGYDNSLPYWICLGCGQMLINPDIETETDIIWRCDECGDLLNIQEGFVEDEGHWVCKKCGFDNKLDITTLYESEDERLLDEANPYKGLSDDEVLELSRYKDIDIISDRDNIILVEDIEDHRRYVKKLLEVYDISVYEYLRANPIPYMPKIHSIYKSKNCLIVIEDYIEGKTVAEILDSHIIPAEHAITIARQVCLILQELHNQRTPIIHRDIKPSNIIVTLDGEVYLLDVNVAKWHNPDKCDDTVYMGTANFAAPEQVGYGFTSSNAKSDIYSVGVLLNVMVTGKFPKEQKAEGSLWPIIEKCMSLEVDNRYSTEELINELDKIQTYEER